MIDNKAENVNNIFPIRDKIIFEPTIIKKISEIICEAVLTFANLDTGIVIFFSFAINSRKPATTNSRNNIIIAVKIIC